MKPKPSLISFVLDTTDQKLKFTRDVWTSEFPIKTSKDIFVDSEHSNINSRQKEIAIFIYNRENEDEEKVKREHCAKINNGTAIGFTVANYCKKEQYYHTLGNENREVRENHSLSKRRRSIDDWAINQSNKKSWVC